MLTCKDCIELLRDYLDGELPEDEAKRLEEHMSECPPCVDFLRTYKATPKICKWALAAKMPILRFFDHGSLPFDDPDAVADTRWPPYVDALNAYKPIIDVPFLKLVFDAAGAQVYQVAS